VVSKLEEDYINGDVLDSESYERYSDLLNFLNELAQKKQREEEMIRDRLEEMIPEFINFDCENEELDECNGYFILNGFYDSIFPIYKHVDLQFLISFRKDRYAILENGLGSRVLAKCSSSQFNILDPECKTWIDFEDETQKFEISFGSADTRLVRKR